MAAPAAAANRIPFTAASHNYIENVFTKTWTPGTAAVDLSPPGFALKSYGYLRGIYLKVKASAAGTGGNLAADAPWNIFSQIAFTQPNGEEMYGGPTWTGYHSFRAAARSGWKYANDPATWPSFANSATSPAFTLPLVFEINPAWGLGALPNQDFSAPWKLQLTGNTSANIWQTAPTTIPTLQVDVFIDCWTVPSAVNPLNPQVQQETAPALLGTLNKWTVQQYAITGGSAFNVLLQRKGNAIRNLTLLLRNTTGARIANTNFPAPFAVRWDGTVIRASDDPVLMADRDYAVRGGQAGSTPVTAQTGELNLSMVSPTGLEAPGAGMGFNMNSFWGTVQSSTLEIDGTWGATAATLEVLTNDVQFVNLSGNPYAFAYAGYLQAPAQPIARS